MTNKEKNMAFFNRKAPGEDKTPGTLDKGETGSVKKAQPTQTGDISVKILGSGCAKCNKLEAAAKAALEQLGMDAAIEHVTDFARIAAFGVMSTPALVVDGKVVSYGKVLKPEEVLAILRKVRG